MPEHDSADTGGIEWFPPSGGRFAAVVGLVLVALVLGYGLLVPGSIPWPVVGAAPLVAVLIWLTLLRPRVGVTDDVLVLRGALHTDWLPLAAVHHVAVRRLLVVFVAEQRYTCVALSRSRRQVRSVDRVPVGERPPVTTVTDYAEDRIRALATDARRRAGVKNESKRQAALASEVRRDRAGPETAALAVTAVAFLVILAWTLVR